MTTGPNTDTEIVETIYCGRGNWQATLRDDRPDRDGRRTTFLGYGHNAEAAQADARREFAEHDASV